MFCLAVVEHKAREANRVLEMEREMLRKCFINLVGLNLSQEKQIFRGAWVSLRHQNTVVFRDSKRCVCSADLCDS